MNGQGAPDRANENIWIGIIFMTIMIFRQNLKKLFRKCSRQQPRGIDILRLDTVPYIWKQLGMSCRNLPQVHNVVRMMRIVTDIVCPGVLLLWEVV